MNEVVNKKFLFEIIRFGFAGGTVAVSHLLFVYVLTSLIGLWYLASSVLSYSCAIVLNFYLQKYFVYQNRNSEYLRRQFSTYIVMSLSSMAANTLFMYIFVSILGWHYLLAQALVIACLSLVNFLLGRNFIFRE